MSVMHWGSYVTVDAGSRVHVSGHDSGRIMLGIGAHGSTFSASLHLDAEQARAIAAELLAAADAVSALEIAEAA